MMTAIRFLALSLAFWHFLRLVDHFFPRARPEPKEDPRWSHVVNATIKKYLRETEVNLLRSRRLTEMLRDKGRFVGTFTVACHEAAGKITGEFTRPNPVKNVTLGEMMTNALRAEGIPDDSCLPPLRGTVPLEGHRYFILDGLLYRMLAYDPARKVVVAEDYKGKRFEFPKTQYLMAADMDEAKTRDFLIGGLLYLRKWGGRT